MVYIENWDDFQKAVEDLYVNAPNRVSLGLDACLFSGMVINIVIHPFPTPFGIHDRLDMFPGIGM